ncbi:putative gamma-butyrolactone biosynthesis enzyme [Kitasatospora setae KM-6054]|uniref:Putative gamma-butyrolactone biosynthesis enzyme n=2 Tax=Kitasatospora setae TaxID=2066 RepID=E4N426_KITSK|nr:ScbA/BarX family gamma-butyrolactone biosynthesis protein [Kitasatospora sp. SID7827]BAJ25957.1 putative gamma-butyrolactone biosynthesis enzyme [Kitasatospora setae KM-6054]BAJ33321.1 putative gamma-butyrolactone biosynthesis enzyme [Kitasatospora setae KM-6054]
MLVTTQPHTGPRPALTTTVAKEYVHRASLSEVFLTGWHQTAPDTFTVTAQWPRSHSFYTTDHHTHDPLLLSETIRQTFPLLTHAAYHLPFGHQLSWSHFQIRLDPRAMRIEPTPAEIELHVTATNIRYHRGLPASMTMHYTARRDGQPLATATTHFHCHTPTVYQRLRAGRATTAHPFHTAPPPPHPLTPTTAGRTHHHDIVLSPTPHPHHWQLRVDTHHPVLFDHPVDHVPGMLLLEATRQATNTLTTPRKPHIITHLDITFNRYVELDTPCYIHAHTTHHNPTNHHNPTHHITATQADTTAFTAHTHTTPLPT